MHKCIGPHKLHLWVLREPVYEVLKPLSLILGKLWQSGEVVAEWKRGSVSPIFKNVMHSKIMEWILLETAKAYEN